MDLLSIQVPNEINEVMSFYIICSAVMEVIRAYEVLNRMNHEFELCVWMFIDVSRRFGPYTHTKKSDLRPKSTVTPKPYKVMDLSD